MLFKVLGYLWKVVFFSLITHAYLFPDFASNFVSF